MQQHKINTARTLFYFEHMIVTAGAESVHLRIPDMLAHGVPYFERRDGESPV
jgi:thioredoxin reductase